MEDDNGENDELVEDTILPDVVGQDNQPCGDTSGDDVDSRFWLMII